MPDEKRPEPKKTVSQTVFTVLIVTLFIVMLLQNIFESKSAQIGFSYQLEHLVNLDLLVPEDSKKSASSGNLVTFYGQFRESLTDASKKRYQFLELLEEHNQQLLQQQKIDEDLDACRKQVESAVGLYVKLSGATIPAQGLVVVNDVYTRPSVSGGISVMAQSLPEKEIVGIDKIRALSGDANEDRIARATMLQGLVTMLRSPVIGVGDDQIKGTLRQLSQDLSSLLSRSGDALFVSSPQFQQSSDKALQGVESVLKAIEVERNGDRFAVLRSVREYRELLQKDAALQAKIDDTDAKLERSYQNVENVVWFFNNEEISSRLLEKQEPELFHQWFVEAQDEWNLFDANKGAAFKAPDQPLNKVLEKQFQSEEMPINYLGYILSLAPLILILVLLYLAFARQVKGMGGNPMDFGKSPARLYPKGANKITFKDVAGIDESLEELEEVVEFLKNPQKFTVLGAKIPKGVLCVGPPGTGKTLVAKAVAGEADCPFFSISGSDFVEMFVGVGASRIRKMFEEAKKNAPCIIFIDEIDAVGRHRGVGMGGGHDEREQTLNQLLVEMDGFDANEGVIIIAATNRPDVLDKALLRPGRFDRQVVIGLPDIKGRFEILKVHAKKVKLDSSVDLMTLAKGTPGCSGADLANLLNEAALLAARRNRVAVSPKDIGDARDKVLYGKERRSADLDMKEKLHTAYHESGHAVVGSFVEHSDPIDKVTIIPRGMSLGSTLFLPEKNRTSYWKKELTDQVAVLMGGRIAEEMFVGDLSSGARQDIERATSIARMMVCDFGMSDKLGSISYGEQSDSNAYNGSRDRKYSEKTAEEIDLEVRSLLESGNERARKILQENRDIVEEMSKMLIEFETLDNEDVLKIIKREWDVDEKKKKIQFQLESLKAAPEAQPELNGPPPIPPEAFAPSVPTENG